ncbi:MAG: hypothetical protein ACFFA4_16755 [Promethearchaeota archaeon]
MKEYKKNMNYRIGVPLIITCPVCGFTFKLFDPKTGKKKELCPICNYHLFEYFKLSLENFMILI